MRYHHTKNKGDQGFVKAMADLTAKGWAALVPLTEQEAFDFVAYREGRFLRGQVKYRAAVKGVIKVPLSPVWADRRGNHVVPVERASIELLCIYCPSTERCYYVDPACCPDCVTLRIEPTRNSQAKGVCWAQDFTEIPKSVLGVPANSGVPLERMAFVRHSHEPRAKWLLSAHSSAG